MTLLKIQRIAISLAAASVCGFFLSAGYMAWRVYLVTPPTGIADLFAESRDITIATLKPCQKDKPETCGLIPAARQTVQDAGATLKAATTQVQQSSTLVTAAAQGVRQASDSVSGISQHLQSAADAATTALKGVPDVEDQAIETMDAAKKPMEKIGGVADQATEDLDTLNAQLKDAAIGETGRNLAATTANVAGITGSLDKMTAHLEKNFDSPQPVWKTAIPMASDVGKIVACLRFHVCVN